MPYLTLLLPLAFIVALAILLQHFLGSLAWAALLAVITWPLHERLLSRGWSALASASLLLVVLIASVIAPSIFLFHTLSNELASLERFLGQINQTGVPAPEWLSRLPLIAKPALEWWRTNLSVPGGLSALIQSTAGDFAPQLTGTVRVLGSIILANALYLFLALLTLFILYLHGPAVVAYVDSAGTRIIPRHFPMLRRLMPLSMRGTALGLCSVALLEGLVLGLAYKVAGAPAPAFLGVITGYLALIPGGAPLAFTSVSLLLLGQGHPDAALGLFCWGAFELFLVDKFVRPRLIGKRVNLPFLAVLFGLLGGVSTMGVLGLFIGPFMMAVLFWWLRGGHLDPVQELSGASAVVRADDR